MKNIYVLATDKPSRLLLSKRNNLQFLKDNASLNPKNHFEGTYQHIYITNDEEIKEGDSIFETDINTINIAGKDYVENEVDFKIILTTDQDLIKDGVQAIDDEFLEWFVKNPSCEEVETERFYSMSQSSYSGIEYEIIFPKEEQKQHLIDMMKSDEELGLYEEPKQETLEEASWKYNPLKKLDGEFLRHAFKEGAKWQQEQDKKMYSELVDLLERLATIYIDDCDLDIKYDKKRLEFIEQFKKK